MRLLSKVGRASYHGAVATVRAVPSILRDLAGIAGAGMIVYGVWQIHQPSAWIVGGAMLVTTALRLAGGESAAKPPPDDEAG